MRRAIATACVLAWVAIACGDARTPARSGDRSSLDGRLQTLAVEALGSGPGALVVVDPRTGGIRALASRPRSTARTPASPGSTFKIVTAAAALEQGVVTPDDVVACPASTDVGGRRIANVGGVGYGEITVERAFAVSCNTAFATIGVRLGTSALLDTARRLGFAVGGEAGGEKGDATIAVPTSRSELALRSFGAQGIRVSPVAMAGIGATLAHDGRSVVPGRTESGNVGEQAVSRGTAREVVAMMREVVRSGTGRGAAVEGLDVAGKTGTADEAGRGSHAWFVALAPASRTELVVVAYLPGAGLGGRGAAALVSRFLTDAFASDPA